MSLHPFLAYFTFGTPTTLQLHGISAIYLLIFGALQYTWFGLFGIQLTHLPSTRAQSSLVFIPLFG